MQTLCAPTYQGHVDIHIQTSPNVGRDAAWFGVVAAFRPPVFYFGIVSNGQLTADVRSISISISICYLVFGGISLLSAGHKVSFLSVLSIHREPYTNNPSFISFSGPVQLEDRASFLCSLSGSCSILFVIRVRG